MIAAAVHELIDVAAMLDRHEREFRAMMQRHRAEAAAATRRLRQAAGG